MNHNEIITEYANIYHKFLCGNETKLPLENIYIIQYNNSNISTNLLITYNTYNTNKVRYTETDSTRIEWRLCLIKSQKICILRDKYPNINNLSDLSIILSYIHVFL